MQASSTLSGPIIRVLQVHGLSDGIFQPKDKPPMISNLDLRILYSAAYFHKDYLPKTDNQRTEYWFDSVMLVGGSTGDVP